MRPSRMPVTIVVHSGRMPVTIVAHSGRMPVTIVVLRGRMPVTIVARMGSLGRMLQIDLPRDWASLALHRDVWRGVVSRC